MAEDAFTGLKVLLVDDEPFIQRLIGRMLNDMGIKSVTPAADGASALDRICKSAGAFDLIICDLEMPAMNGFDFVRALRNDKGIPNPGVPVLILTGAASQEYLEESIRLGIHGFLAKPVSKTTLETRIVSALNAPPIDPKVLER